MPAPSARPESSVDWEAGLGLQMATLEDPFPTWAGPGQKLASLLLTANVQTFSTPNSSSPLKSDSDLLDREWGTGAVQGC